MRNFFCVLAALLLTVNPALVCAQSLTPSDSVTAAVPEIMDLSELANLSELTIGKEQVVIIDAGHSDSVILPGNLTNHGQLFVASLAGTQTSVAIAAINISNSVTGLISSVLPTGLLTGQSTLSLNFSLTALNSLVNQGTISSSGSLAMTAPQIVNQLLPGSIGGAPAIQAVRDVSLVANSIVNTGIIQSLSGNVDISALAGNLNMNNTLGQLLANQGEINILGSATQSGTLNIIGGDLIATAVNLNAPLSTIDLNVSQLLGTLNVTATAAHVQAATDSLRIGRVEAYDPVFYNIGNIVLGDEIEVGEDLAIIASRNITSDAGDPIFLIKAVNLGAGNGLLGQGQNITLVAGANIITAPGNPLSPGGDDAATISPITLNLQPSATGGSIDFSNSFIDPDADGLQIEVNAEPGSGADGGNVMLAAFSNGTQGGKIILAIDSAITLHGDGAGSNGNLTLIAGAQSGTSVTLGSVESDEGLGNAPNTGVVSIYTAQPTSSDGQPIVFETDASISSGNQFAPSGTIQNASVEILNDVEASGKIVITAGLNISTPTVEDKTVPNIGDAANGSPQQVAVRPGPNGSFAYVADFDAQLIYVFDDDQEIISSFPVPGNPEAVIFSADFSTLYVLDGANDQVHVFDTATQALIAPSIPVGDEPTQALFNGNFLYVLNSDSFSVIDTTTNSVVGAPIPVGLAGSDLPAISFNPTTDLFYVAYFDPNNAAAGSIGVFDASGANAGSPLLSNTLNLSFNPGALAATNQNHLYVGDLNNSQLIVIDAATTLITKTIDLPLSSTTQIATGANGAIAYVVTQSATASNFAVITSANDTVIEHVPIDQPAESLALGADTGALLTFYWNPADSDLVALQIPALVAPTLELTSINGAINVLAQANQVVVNTGTGQVAIFSTSAMPNVEINILQRNLGSIGTTSLATTNTQLEAITGAVTSLLDPLQKKQLSIADNSPFRVDTLASGTYVISEAGTDSTVIEDDPEVVVLRSGKMLVDTGDKPVTVTSGSSTITVNANSAVMVDATNPNALKITAVGRGGQSRSAHVATKAGDSLDVESGERLVIVEDDSDEMLIPVDGVDETAVQVGRLRSVQKYRKSTISLKQFNEREVMIAGHLVRIGGNSNKTRTMTHLNAAKLDQESKSLFGKDIVEKLTPAITGATYEHPVRVIAGEGSAVTMTESGSIDLKSGDLFVSADGDLTINCGSYQVSVKDGTLLHCRAVNDDLSIKVAYGPVLRVQVDNHTVKISEGQEAIFLKDGHGISSLKDNIGRRGGHSHRLGQGTVTITEFSITSLLLASKDIKAMMHSPHKEDRQALYHMMKNACAISLAHQHGPYNSIKP